MNAKNIAIVYFSQSGNTKKVAQTIKEAFVGQSFSVELIPLKKAAGIDLTEYDAFGIGAPCFYSRAPAPVVQFLHSLPSMHLDAFVFSSSGGAPGMVLSQMSEILKAKGANVVAGHIARGECFYPLPFMLHRFPSRPDADDLQRVEAFAEQLCSYFQGKLHQSELRGKKDYLTPRNDFYSLMGRMQNEAFVRLTIPEPKLNEEKCDSCKTCYKACPTGAISMNEYPRIDDKCIRCYRCHIVCPEGAYDETDLTLADIAGRAIYNETFEHWFGDLEPQEKAYP